LLINYNIYFVANPVAVINPINWGRLRLRRRRVEEAPVSVSLQLTDMLNC